MSEPTPDLKSARLLLRKFCEDDADALYPALSDPEAMRYWSHPPRTSIEETRAYLAQSNESPGWRWWSITREGDDRALGWVSVGAKRQGGVSEIGYILSPDEQGQGIAAEAVSTVIEYLFAIEGERRVFADTDPDNDGSIALLKRLGFTLEGRLRHEWETHIGVRDSLIWGLLREEWVSPVAPARAPG